MHIQDQGIQKLFHSLKQASIQQVCHLEDASLQLESAVSHSHDLQPVSVVDLLGVQLLEQWQYGSVLANL